MKEIVVKKRAIDALYYEHGNDVFGLNFPLGIDAKELATKLDKDTKELSKMTFDHWWGTRESNPGPSA